MQIPKSVLKVCQNIKSAGFEAFIVGGAVRDSCIGLPPKDWDVATNARPENIISMFDKVVPTGIKFGTVTVLGDMDVEVTTYRVDGRYSDNRRPDEVKFSDSIEEDLSRRDFTMNAIAYDPITKVSIDPFDGKLDIQSGLIKCVGKPMERFKEDGLRSMRAVRFSAQLLFTIESRTLMAICASHDEFSRISMERVRDELFKILKSPFPWTGINLLVNTGLMSLIMPDVSKLKRVVQNPYDTSDMYNHSIAVMSRLPSSDPILKLSGLLHDIGKVYIDRTCDSRDGWEFSGHAERGALCCESIARHLKLPGDESSRLIHLVKYHMDLVQHESPVSMRKMIARLGKDNLEDFLWLRRADVMQPNVHCRKSVKVDMEALQNSIDSTLADNPPLCLGDLEINGDDVKNVLSIGPGPKIGETLNWLLDKTFEDPLLNSRDKLLDLIKERETND